MKRSRKTASSRRFSWPIGLYRVAGDSMRPTLEHGQLLVGWRWGKPLPGKIVVAMRGKPLVKRVTAVSPEGVWLQGDNPGASTDSRQFGKVDAGLIEAVIIWPRHAAD